MGEKNKAADDRFNGRGGKNRAASPVAARFSGRAHVFPKQAAAAGDWGFGRAHGVDADGGRRQQGQRRRHLKLALLLMNALLRAVSCVLASDLQNGCMEIVSVFAIY